MVSPAHELELGKNMQQVSEIPFIRAEPRGAASHMERGFWSKLLLVITDGKISLWHGINHKKYLTAHIQGVSSAV